MKFKVLTDFKGSPDGIRVIEYKKDQSVELGTDFSMDLAEVALTEKWVTKMADKPPAKKKAAKK